MTDLPRRKANRLEGYDYSQNGMYFVTVCTKVRKCILSAVVGTTKQAKQPVWQSRFYDHVIRDDYDYLVKCRYIDENPAKWLMGKDKYYA